MQARAMTAPRRVLPGTTYLLTRRCSQRQFLLRPSRATNQVVGFLLAVAAERFRVEVHAFCVMSNHVHLVVTDREARLPAFGQFLDSLVGRAMNALLGRSEHFWGPPSFSAVALNDPSDVVDKVAYLLANPVAAGLVRRGRMWPGLWSAPEQFGAGALEFERPARFFRKQGARSLPERAVLRLVTPPGFDSPERFRRAVRDALHLREALAASAVAAGARLPRGPARARPAAFIRPFTPGATRRSQPPPRLPRQVATHPGPRPARRVPPRLPPGLRRLAFRSLPRPLPRRHLPDARPPRRPLRNSRLTRSLPAIPSRRARQVWRAATLVLSGASSGWT